MNIRHARISDAQTICSLINFYAERGRMLHRSLESVYDCIREFLVAEENGDVLGCVAIDVFWADLAEVKSLAVAQDARGRGVGRRLVEAAAKDAARIGVTRLFALTYEKEFFEACGFTVVSKDVLCEKVWRECFVCPKKDQCDEIAMIRDIRSLAEGGNPAT
ncbi:MAG: N-acetyltransferase [Phycisphaerae bacterium]|nr:N-acetyltransferase [Phycisphaerae bacterium]